VPSLSVAPDAKPAIVDAKARNVAARGHQDTAGSKFAPAGLETAPLSLIVCGLAIGALLGAFAPAIDQRGIDGALVLAGIVHYPPQSPLAPYFLDSWTSIHQIGALLLRAGIAQNHVNTLFILLPCALLVCGYVMIIYGVSGRFLISLLAGPLCYLANPLAPLFASPDYTTLGLLWSQVTEGTFGFWAHAGAVWVIGCVAAGRYGLAGFSALALLCVHPVMGAYMTALLAATLVAGRIFFGLHMPGLAKGAAFGACVTLISLAAYFKTRSGFSAPIDQIAYDAYLRLWDVHQSHVMTSGNAIRIAVAAVVGLTALSVFLSLRIARRDSTVLVCVLLLLAITGSTAAYYAVHLVPQFLPELVLRALPARLLNVQAFVSTPLTLGLAICIADRAIKNKTGAFVWAARLLPIAVALLVIVSATVYALQRRNAMLAYAQTVIDTRILGRLSPVQQQSEAFWRDVRAAGVSGLVLTSSRDSATSLFHGHLPIAVYGDAMDFFHYIPQAAGRSARIVTEGYGIPFSDPPPEILHAARLPVDAGRDYWAGLSGDDWCRISNDLGITALVAPKDWPVKLPALVRGPELTLYTVSCH
jgi:hypothetical protein